MIDDPETVTELMAKMEAHLPIPVKPTVQVVRQLRDKGLRLNTERLVFIKRIFYGGDEGGIVCDVTPTQGAKANFVVSLTHLRIAPGHPLYHDIRAYQQQRIQRIARSGE